MVFTSNSLSISGVTAGRERGLQMWRLSMGINALVGEQRKVTARIGSQQHSGGESQEVGAPRGCWEIPAMPPTSSGLSRKEGEGQLAFKPEFPSEEADNKASCQGLEVETGEAERRGGYVKLTAALNLSSRPRLDPISPRRPRTRWQDLSCRRHQWADEDSGPAGQSASQSLARWVSPPDSCVTQQSSRLAEKTDARLHDHTYVISCCLHFDLWNISAIFARFVQLFTKKERKQRVGQ